MMLVAKIKDASKLSQLIKVLSLDDSGNDCPLIHFLADSREIGLD
jgi:hypothetical protein